MVLQDIRIHQEVVEVVEALVVLVEVFLDVMVGMENHILFQQMVTHLHRPNIGSVVEVVEDHMKMINKDKEAAEAAVVDIMTTQEEVLFLQVEQTDMVVM